MLGHVPIGGWDCVDWYSNALYDIISTYPDVVSSAFMGHTHMDQLHIMRSNDSARTPLVRLLSHAGSVITVSDRAPPRCLCMFRPQ